MLLTPHQLKISARSSGPFYLVQSVLMTLENS